MSADVYGIGIGEFIAADDFQATQSENGGWTATQSFTFLEESLTDTTFRNKFSKGTRITELNTSLPEYWARIYLDKTDVANREGPFQTIVAHFAGYAGFETDPDGTVLQPIVPTYTLRGGLRSRSIAEHPDVVALSELNRSLVEKTIKGDYIWDFTDSKLKIMNESAQFIALFNETDDQPSAGDATNFCKLASKGITTYDSPTMFWSKSWESEWGIATAQLNNLGKVDVPDGSPPTPNGSRDWRLNDAYQEQIGILYRNRLEWELSERGGWDGALYDY